MEREKSRTGGGNADVPESHSLPVVREGLISECAIVWSDFSMWAIVLLSHILFADVMLRTKEN
jgi:hypothetical protein